MSTQFESHSLPEVIVRGWGGEPTLLIAYALQQRGKWVLVGKPHAKRPIGMPIEDVFDFDPLWLEQLTSAYSGRHRERLEELYNERRAKNKSSTGGCSKYQDVLNSRHETKSEIANSGSAANRRQQ